MEEVKRWKEWRGRGSGVMEVVGRWRWWEGGDGGSLEGFEVREEEREMTRRI